jgi:CRISPR-associated protein Csm3
MELKGYKAIKGLICCVTGLRIGGASNIIEIGGLDNPIIKNPVDDWPYMPGSSIKGKVRSLLEWELGKISSNGDVHSCTDVNCEICRIFGNSEDVDKGPSRGIFRDAVLTENSKQMLQKMKETKGLSYGEIKWENRINRLLGKAEHPRQMERLPAGTEFDFQVDYRIFDLGDGGKTDLDNFQWLLHGLWLLKQDALGGCGSRGYGQIDFRDVFVINPDGTKEEVEVKDRYKEITGREKRGVQYGQI